jgi:hypothetical protein
MTNGWYGSSGPGTEDPRPYIAARFVNAINHWKNDSRNVLSAQVRTHGAAGEEWGGSWQEDYQMLIAAWHENGGGWVCVEPYYDDGSYFPSNPDVATNNYMEAW